MQPPDGKINLGMDRKTKFHELLKNIKANFKRLRVIYEKIEENFPSNREINFEVSFIAGKYFSSGAGLVKLINIFNIGIGTKIYLFLWFVGRYH